MPSWAPSESIDSISATTRSDALAVGLVDHEDVGDLHDPGLQGLHLVAQAGHQDHQAHVGGPHDLHLVLAHAHGLDQDHVLPRGREHGEHVAGGGGQAAQVAARGHRPDEHAGVEGVGLHADAVAQDGAAAVGRGGVHGHDPHGLALRAEVGGRAGPRGSTSPPPAAR